MPDIGILLYICILMQSYSSRQVQETSNCNVQGTAIIGPGAQSDTDLGNTYFAFALPSVGSWCF